jgi:GNAT superfamily N-acetyltransferase
MYSTPRPIQIDDDCSAFDCGNPALNDWLRERALKFEGRSARSYVTCEGNAVLGYYCLTSGAVAHTGTSARFRQNMPDPVPVAVIGRLAIDSRHQKRGLGKALLKDAFQRSIAASAIIGIRAVIVHAVDHDAANFYASYGFKPFPTNPLTLWISIQDVTGAIT